MRILKKTRKNFLSPLNDGSAEEVIALASVS
jgi:hypothetical protein